MKVFVCLYVIVLAYLFSRHSDKASAQYFDDPSRHFQYLQMGLVHRGSFNNTDCSRNLLNCWEIIKPDLICSHWVVYESVCGVMHTDCNDRSGLTFRDIVPIYEGFCKYRRYDARYDT
uniref:Seminal fluid protein HACP040 n=1 Tax=Heliconius melpomene TaxID=34740 RepID=D9HQ90_HELME|nr:seminal fluid protein HACP040 [Heliconius melpomene]